MTKKNHRGETKAIILHTPCLEAGMFPNCSLRKGRCELEKYAVHKQDKDHIIQRCETPSLVVLADFYTSVPIRPLVILEEYKDTKEESNDRK